MTGEQPSRWITRARPRIDRVACPWLVRRFIDPAAQFFYVPPSCRPPRLRASPLRSPRGALAPRGGPSTQDVLTQAARLKAVPYDIAGAPISHEGERCSFDALLRAFELQLPALDTLAIIVRGADTDRLSLAPQAAGLLAVSLGLSRLHADDDHAMLAAAMPVYDALFEWCRRPAAAQ